MIDTFILVGVFLLGMLFGFVFSVKCLCEWIKEVAMTNEHLNKGYNYILGIRDGSDVNLEAGKYYWVKIGFKTEPEPARYMGNGDWSRSIMISDADGISREVICEIYIPDYYKGV